MADGYDRSDNDSSGGGSFVMGLLTGTVLGAGLGMLFAPKAGADLRNQVLEQAGNLANTASEQYRRASETAGQYAERGRDMAGDLAGRGREMYDKTRDAVAKGADEAQRYVRDAAGGESDVTERMATASSSGVTGPSSMGSGSTGPRPAGLYTGAPPTGSTPASGGTHSGGGSRSGSGGSGGSRG